MMVPRAVMHLGCGDAPESRRGRIVRPNLEEDWFLGRERRAKVYQCSKRREGSRCRRHLHFALPFQGQATRDSSIELRDAVVEPGCRLLRRGYRANRLSCDSTGLLISFVFLRILLQPFLRGFLPKEQMLNHVCKTEILFFFLI